MRFTRLLPGPTLLPLWTAMVLSTISHPASAQGSLCFHRPDGDFARAPVDPIFQLTHGFTLELWLRPEQLVADCALLGLDTEGCDGSGWSLSEFGADLRLWLLPNHQTYASGILAPGEWQHVAVSWTEGTGQVVFYRNGLPWSSGTTAAHFPAGNDMVQLGGEPGCPVSVSFEGSIDEVRIWDRPCTAAEILAAHDRQLSAGEIADPSLVGYWQFEEGTGQTSVDVTGRGHDFTLGSSPAPETVDPGWALVQHWVGPDEGSWGEASHWAPPGVPAECHDVVVEHGSVSVDCGGPCRARSVRVTDDNPNVIVRSGSVLTVEQFVDVEAGGTLTLEPSAQVTTQTLGIRGGRVAGSGSITANVVHTEGDLAPGQSPGRIRIDGGYAMGPGARLLMEMGALAAGVRDTLEVTGAAALAGEMRLEFLPGITPSVGDLYGLVTTGSSTGNFHEVTFGGEAIDSLMTVIYTDSTITIEMRSEFSEVPTGTGPSGPTSNPSPTGILLFRGRTSDDGEGAFELTLARDAEVQLEVFDIHGRRVTVLRHGWETAGVHTYPLDRGESNPVTSGVYFARLVIADGDTRECRAARVTMVR